MPTDLRKYSKQTTFRLVAGGLAIVFMIAAGSAYFLYGTGAAITAALCFLAGITPFVLVYFFLLVFDLIVEMNRKNE
jgi:hypothetical protein